MLFGCLCQQRASLQDSQLPKWPHCQHGHKQQTGSTLGGLVFGRGQGGIFNSYGLPPNFYTDHFTMFLAYHPGDTERNVGTLQALNSNVCGYYCLFYLFRRSRGQDFKSIVKRFSLDNRQANDRRVVQFVKSAFVQRKLPLLKRENCVQCNASRRQALQCICYGY